MMFTRLFTRLSILCVVIAAVTGCGKDKYDTRPSLKFKSISSYVIPKGGLFEIRLEYTDAEGDLSVADSALTIRRSVLRCANGTSDFKYQLPAIPATKNSSGEVVIRFENGTVNYTSQGYAIYTPATCPQASGNDTTTLRFFIRDKAGHVSDTVSVDKPVIIKR